MGENNIRCYSLTFKYRGAESCNNWYKLSWVGLAENVEQAKARCLLQYGVPSDYEYEWVSIIVDNTNN